MSKRGWLALGLALALLCSTTRAAPAVQTLPFIALTDFLRVTSNIRLGEVAGVAVTVTPKPRVYVFSRNGNVTGPAFGAAAAQLLEFDLVSGKFVREIGKDAYAWSFAHAVRVDKDGNIWAVDSGSDTVVEFAPDDGRVRMVFGRKKPAADEALPWKHLMTPLDAIDGQFRQPTDVTWNSKGDIFISDGHINSRIAKYNKNGDWVKSFGQPGSAHGDFNIPHNLVTDANDNLYVADAGNKRIQVFNEKGNFVREITITAPVPSDAVPWMGNKADAVANVPWALCITPLTSSSSTQYLFVADAFPGRIYKLSLDGQLLGMYGQSGRQAGQFGWIHALACRSETELYVADLLNWRVQKLVQAQ